MLFFDIVLVWLQPITHVNLPSLGLSSLFVGYGERWVVKLNETTANETRASSNIQYSLYGSIVSRIYSELEKNTVHFVPPFHFAKTTNHAKFSELLILFWQKFFLAIIYFAHSFVQCTVHTILLCGQGCKYWNKLMIMAQFLRRSFLLLRSVTFSLLNMYLFWEWLLILLKIFVTVIHKEFRLLQYRTRPTLR